MNGDKYGNGKSFWGLMAGAIVTAAMATSCCIAPLLFLLFGLSVGSLSFLSIFAPYQMYLSALSVLIVGYLWLSYFVKARKGIACSGSKCRNYILYLSMGTVFVVIMISYQ